MLNIIMQIVQDTKNSVAFWNTINYVKSFLHTFDQFRQVGRVLRFNRNTHDGRHGELHNLHVMRILECRDGTGLHQELIDADKTANITCKLTNKH